MAVIGVISLFTWLLGQLGEMLVSRCQIVDVLQTHGCEQQPTLTHITLAGRDGRFGFKVGQIGPKWDKSGAFSDEISVHLAPARQMHGNLI